MNTAFQMIYIASEENENEIHPRFQTDAKAMQEAGILVGTKPLPNVKQLMYKGFTILEREKYPKDSRYIHSFEENIKYNYMSLYYPHIADLTIETFFVDDLYESLPALIRHRGWERVFIKKDFKALEHIEEGKSVWPDTSFEEMKELYKLGMQHDGKYAIRRYIEPEKLKNEIRYWVLNGRIYRRDGIIPEIVKEAALRLNKLGSKYYTIDATPEFVVEVNPGESSDRHAENSAELFASWIKKEFVDNK